MSHRGLSLQVSNAEFDAESLSQLRAQKRRSIGFDHSWEYNNIDVTHEFAIDGIGNVHQYLRKKWDAEVSLLATAVGESPASTRRNTYTPGETENAAKLRQSVLELTDSCDSHCVSRCSVCHLLRIST